MRVRPRTVLLLVLVAVMINLPLGHSTWLDHRVARDGVEVNARVTEDRTVGGEYFVAFSAPVDGRDDVTGQAQVDRATYDEAVASGRIGVRVLPDSSGAYVVDGAVGSRIGLVVTLLADLFLLVMGALFLLIGARSRAPLVLRAVGDLERCPPGAVLDRIDTTTYVVCGEVHSIGQGEVVLDLEGRLVRVILDGHHNPAGYQQPVRVTAVATSALAK